MASCFYLWLWRPFCSTGLRIFDSHLRNIPVKLFQNLSTDLAEGVVKSLFLFIAEAAILFNIAESFEQFW